MMMKIPTSKPMNALKFMGYILLLLSILVFIFNPNLIEEIKSDRRKKSLSMKNNHTATLSLRCFTFKANYPLTHLKSSDELQIDFHRYIMLPSSTMVNCSTNRGTFVAYQTRYECAEYESCKWKFDERAAYLLNPKNNTWGKHVYAPTFESLNRGGVVKDFYSS